MRRRPLTALTALLLSLLALAGSAPADLVLSRQWHGTGADQHRDTIQCAASSAARHGSLERLFEDFVLPDTLWCQDDAAGSACSDRTSHTTFRLVSLWCSGAARRNCTAAFECGDLVRDRFWICLAITAATIIVLVVAVRSATRWADAVGEARALASKRY